MATQIIGISSKHIMEPSCVDQMDEMPSDKLEDGAILKDKQSDGQAAGSNQQKRPHRRKPSKKKRKWKPYSKMTWEERKALEEKEKSKAVRIREEMKERGRPVAPYNTTQFLMEEHDPFDSDTFETRAGINTISNSGMIADDGDSFSDIDEGVSEDAESGVNGKSDCNQNPSCSIGDGSMDDYTDSPHMEPEFISQDFSETYERVHEESLQTMTRDELMAEHIDLEKKLSVLQDQLASLKRSQEKKLKVLESVVENLEFHNEKLKSDNAKLLKENEGLKSGIELSGPSGKRCHSIETSGEFLFHFISN